MDVRQIRYFCAIVEHGSISRAARAMFITQPALSKSLQNLEEELGVALFDRRKKTLVLNKAGELAYLRFSAMLHELNGLGQELASYRNVPEKIVVYNSLLLFEEYLLREYQMSYPDLIEFHACAEQDISVNALLEHSATLLFTPEPIEAKHVICRNVFDDRLLVRVPENDPLSSRSRIRTDELAGRRIFLGVLNSPTTALISNILSRHGIPVSSESEVSAQTALSSSGYQIYHLKKTRSVCFTTKVASSFLEVPGYRVLEIEDVDAYIPYYAAYLRQNAAAVEHLLNWLRQRAERS